MTIFTATIRHHSIKAARVIDCGADIEAAKDLAGKEFADEQRDYIITVYGQRPNCAPEIYVERKVSEQNWIDRS